MGFVLKSIEITLWREDGNPGHFDPGCGDSGEGTCKNSTKTGPKGKLYQNNPVGSF